MDLEGVEGPSEVALISNEGEVEQKLRAYAEAGATDFPLIVQVPVCVHENPEEASELLAHRFAGFARSPFYQNMFTATANTATTTLRLTSVRLGKLKGFPRFVDA